MNEERLDEISDIGKEIYKETHKPDRTDELFEEAGVSQEELAEYDQVVKEEGRERIRRLDEMIREQEESDDEAES